MRAPLLRPATSLCLASALALVLVPFDLAGKDPPALPHPAPQARADDHDAVAENTRCEGCHTEIAAEWRRSLHKQAWEDPVFLAAYSIEPLAFCRGCHAPEADPAHAPGAPARAIGVGCVTCHVQDDEIVGPRPRVATKDAHAVIGDARAATAQACAGCHQFDFPLRAGAPMQDTGEEHRAGKHATTACQACHMPTVSDPVGNKHRSHVFAASKDPALLRSAVQASAARTTGQAITVTLAAAHVGHAFPTGDMFRRLEVRAAVLDAAGDVATRSPSVSLERKFAVSVTKKGTDRVEIDDTRLPSSGAPRDAVLLFPEDVRARTIRWEVAYQRMSTPMAHAFGLDPQADEILVASGTLPPETPSPGAGLPRSD